MKSFSNENKWNLLITAISIVFLGLIFAGCMPDNNDDDDEDSDDLFFESEDTPTAPTSDTVFTVSGGIINVESMTALPSEIPGFFNNPTTTECPQIVLAAQNGAALVNACDGNTRIDMTESLFSPQNNYATTVFVVPAGETGEHAILMNDALKSINPSTGKPYSFGSTIGTIPSTGIPLDATNNGNDIQAGGVFTKADGYLGQVYWDDISNYADTNHSVGINLKSVICNSGFTGCLGVTDDSRAVYLQFSSGVYSGPETKISDINNDPRRVRCDFTAGICASSDFANDELYTYKWDGTGTPTEPTTNSTTIGDGPVGIDIKGTEIVSTGYNDDTYSITIVDTNGNITGTTSFALPTGCTQPGHAIFINDDDLLISCNGNNAIAYIVR